MVKFKCSVCGFTFENEIDFEAAKKCPVCGHTKDSFVITDDSQKEEEELVT